MEVSKIGEYQIKIVQNGLWFVSLTLSLTQKDSTVAYAQVSVRYKNQILHKGTIILSKIMYAKRIALVLYPEKQVTKN